MLFNNIYKVYTPSLSQKSKKCGVGKLNQDSNQNQERYQGGYSSPDETIKHKSVELLHQCISLNSTSFNDNDKYSFAKIVKDLSIRLERWSTPEQIKETKALYEKMEEELKKISVVERYTEKDKEIKKQNIKYEYSLEVHEQNHRILMGSPIVQIETTGELDITDDDAIVIIRGGKRNDSTKIVYK